MTILLKILMGVVGVVFVSSFFTTEQTAPQPATTSPEPITSSIQEESTPITEVPQSDAVPTNSELYTVQSVVDGDTIKILMGTSVETVRLIGIDTPETVHPSKPVECFGREASNKTKEILIGKQVSIEKDASQDERDKYGRLLAYIFLEDGTNVNKLLIEEGYAYEYTYNLPYKYQSEFRQAESDACSNKRGLWADGVCDTQKTIETLMPTTKIVPKTQQSNCDSNYSGACVPIASDVDCASGSGNGPAYVDGPVYIVGTDIYGLDRDRDGVACER
jgi:micrococcal nuclease